MRGYLGIDVGTSAVKAALIDGRTGAMLASATAPVRVACPEPGAREVSAAELERALRTAADRLRHAAGRAWRGVAGIGLAAQGGSGMLVDARDGSPRTPMHLWNDIRAAALAPELAARATPRQWRAWTGGAGPANGLACIAWFQRHAPAAIDEHALYAGAGDWLVHRLTGAWRQDAGNAIQQGAYHAGRARLVPGPLRLLGWDLPRIAPLRPAHEAAPLAAGGARLLGLPAGVPVTGPYFDHEAGFAAVADAGRSPLQCSLGTAWVGNFIAAAGGTLSPGMNLPVPNPLGEGRLVVRVMRAGTVTWDWALRTFAHERPERARRLAESIFAERLLPPAGLVGLPWLTRPGDPGGGAGGFLGLAPDAGRHDLLRAALLGMALEFRRVFEPVLGEGRCDRAILCGGVSRAPYAAALLAGLLAPHPVLRVTDPAFGARGALMAFGRRVRRAATQRVPRPAAALVKELQGRYEGYLARLERMPGLVPA